MHINKTTINKSFKNLKIRNPKEKQYFRWLHNINISRPNKNLERTACIKYNSVTSSCTLSTRDQIKSGDAINNLAKNTDC